MKLRDNSLKSRMQVETRKIVRLTIGEIALLKLRDLMTYFYYFVAPCIALFQWKVFSAIRTGTCEVSSSWFLAY